MGIYIMKFRILKVQVNIIEDMDIIICLFLIK